MREYELPTDGRGVLPVPDHDDPSGIDAELHRARFDEMSEPYKRGEFSRRNEDGSVTRIVAFERYIDPLDKSDLNDLVEFRLRAAASGYREAFSPLVLQTSALVNPRESVSVTREGSDRPRTIVQFGYEKPAAQTGPTPKPR